MKRQKVIIRVRRSVSQKIQENHDEETLKITRTYFNKKRCPVNSFFTKLSIYQGQNKVRGINGFETPKILPWKVKIQNNTKNYILNPIKKNDNDKIFFMIKQH